MNFKAAQTEVNSGHEMMDLEDASTLVLGLKDKISITLEGVDIVRGNHEKYGPVTIVMPAAGQSSLLYPFAGNIDS